MRWLSTLGGLVVMALAITVMVNLDAAPAEQPTSASGEIIGVWLPEPAPPAPVAEAVAPVTPVDPLQDAGVGELDPALASVLASSGYTEFVTRSDLTATLDPNVVATLIDEGAVLLVPSTEGGG
jgi:alpha-acetolactate decarboxylase